MLKSVPERGSHVARGEDIIRDFLAENLELISHEFEFVQKEFPLPNAFGTRGYIDILARDEHYNFVIIEIKRSNQTAREAVQEVVKYANLLKQNYQL